MQHYRLRCKHCGKEYTYCTYGNGPEYGTQEGCSMEYCAERQKTIDKALEAIPRRYVVEYTLLDDYDNNNLCKRYAPVCQTKFPSIDFMAVNPLPKPKGDCFYMDLPYTYE